LRAALDRDHETISVRRQCQLLGLARSSGYYDPARPSADDLAVMRQVDQWHTALPIYGSRRLADELGLNRKRVQRLMRVMEIAAVGPKPHTSRPAPGHRIFPYLLRGVTVDRADQVWSADITYVPLADGFAYLVAVMEWYSRYVLSWRLSNTADGNFVREALDAALARGVPEIFNTDQGTQFTAAAFVERVQEAGARVSMDGRGRALDNVFIERLWRSVKHEHVYLYDYGTVREADAGLARYFRFYNECRRHQGLGGRTPAEVYFGRRVAPVDNGERLKRIIAVLNN
jgi:putative transposase